MKKQLGHCLVGRWEVKAVQCPNLDCLKTWGMRLWNLKERVSFSIVEGYLGKWEGDGIFDCFGKGS